MVMIASKINLSCNLLVQVLTSEDCIVTATIRNVELFSNLNFPNLSLYFLKLNGEIIIKITKSFKGFSPSFVQE